MCHNMGCHQTTEQHLGQLNTRNNAQAQQTLEKEQGSEKQTKNCQQYAEYTLQPWAVLIQSQREKLLPYLTAILQCQSLAEDALQDTFVRLSSLSAQQHHAIDNQIAYCYQTAKHIAFDILRKRARDNWVDIDTLPVAQCIDEGTNIETDMLAWHAKKRISHTISTLPIRHKTILGLYQGGEFKQKDIAKICAISPTLVNFILNEVVDTCKKALAPWQLA